MVALAPALGALFGVGATCFKNSLCYLPWYRKPWEHVLSGTAAAYAFAWVADKEDEMVKQLEEYYAKAAGKAQE
ncbi:hypothetical protein Rsub_07021 [Raphidocelis subcapitata]|uniref:Uncharacterized protein n=1 Tax=Raphidocelis subcapitata TaxID=307507 RepID=A0A2V0PBE2_9CHLO|nr:hypothetical protein Rsub_07021 [Raphidocelis subcapitata]|eukprot:GBF94487.1 hypothetical protein Rsub_07021 [Raphidocelis subcapitata]